MTFNGLMVQQLNHLGEYKGRLVPRDNQDFDPYVPPLRSLIHRCVVHLRWENNTRLLGSPRLFAFLYKLFFYLIFLFSNDFLVPKKTQLRTQVDSRYHGGGPNPG